MKLISSLFFKTGPLWETCGRRISYCKSSERRCRCTLSSSLAMELKEIVRKLNGYAPTALAESWDNVGLLVEPTPPHCVSRMLLTNDLTEAVLEEGVKKKVELILSYHPPIFVPLKRLTQSSWKERVIVKCIENKIAVFSPHTSYDAVEGGVTDWLIEPFGTTARPIGLTRAQRFPTAGGYRLELTLSEDLTGALQNKLSSLSTLPGVSIVAHIPLGEALTGGTRLCLNCTADGLSQVVAFIDQFEHIRQTMEILPLDKPPVPGAGSGRIIKMDAAVTLQQAVVMVKSHLRLDNVRLAPAAGQTLESPINTVAVCAGAGSSILRGVKADLFVTGEMSHHEVLDATQLGTSVILCDHSNTERGFLRVLKDNLDKAFEGKVLILISQSDKDPLAVV